MPHRRALLLITTLILLLNPATAQTLSSDGSSYNGWTLYKDNIDSCDGTCTTTDSFTAEVTSGQVYLTSGSTGYCGTGGLKKSFTVPEDGPEMSFNAKAWDDYWGPPIQGVKVNGNWVRQFDSPGGEQQSWGEQHYTVDMSNYSGQTVTVRTEIGDESQEWCDMGDHGKELWVSNISFSSTGQSYDGSVTYSDGGSVYIGTGQTYKVTVDADHTLEVVSVEASGEDSVTYKINGQLYTNEEGETFSLDGRKIEVEKVVVNDSQNNGTATFHMGVIDHDLSTSDDVFEGDAAVVYGPYSDVYKNVASDLKASTGGPLVKDSSSEIPDLKQDKDLVLVGGPSVNQLTQELAEAGKTVTAEEWENGQGYGMLHLVEDAFSKNNDVLIVAGYSQDELKYSKNYIQEVWRGKHLDTTRGKDRLELSVATNNLKDLELQFNKDQVKPGETISLKLTDNGETIDPSNLDSNRLRYVFKHEAEVIEEGNSLDTTQITVPTPSDPEFSGYGTHKLEITYNASSGEELYAQDKFEILNPEGHDLAVENLKTEKRSDGSVKVTATIRSTYNETVSTRSRWVGKPGPFPVMSYSPGLNKKTTVYTSNYFKDSSTVGFEVDFLGSRQESDESNNILKKTVGRSSQLDLEVTALDARKNSDGSVNVIATVQNTGQKPVTARVHWTGKPGPNPVKTFEPGLNRFSTNYHVKSGQSERNVGFNVDILKAVDEADETNNKVVKTIDLAEAKKHRIHLNRGWNMISVPEMTGSAGATAEGFYLSDLRDDCRLESYRGHEVWAFDGNWKHPSAVDSSQGVMVNSKSECTAEIDPTKWPVSGDPVQNENQLSKGWNLISVPKPVTLSQIGGNCEFKSYQGTPVWHFLSDSQSWQQLGRSVNQLKPTRGYYVYTKDRCKISFENVSSEPPIPTGNVIDRLAGWMR